MKQGIFEIKDNRETAAGVFTLKLVGDAADNKRAGQFVNILIEGKTLRRPFSVCDFTAESLTIVYKVVGEGTEILSKMRGGKLDVLSGLGNGFFEESIPNNAVLVGGGVGTPPIYALAKRLKADGKSVSVCLGFNGEGDVLLTEEFEALGITPLVSTMDGTRGARGIVTDLFDFAKYAVSCGPEKMMHAVYDKCADGQFCFEARMACGFGACMGCSCQTKYGAKRICRDGPVLLREEIIW